MRCAAFSSATNRPLYVPSSEDATLIDSSAIQHFHDKLLHIKERIKVGGLLNGTGNSDRRRSRRPHWARRWRSRGTRLWVTVVGPLKQGDLYRGRSRCSLFWLLWTRSMAHDMLPIVTGVATATGPHPSRLALSRPSPGSRATPRLWCTACLLSTPFGQSRQDPPWAPCTRSAGW